MFQVSKQAIRQRSSSGEQFQETRSTPKTCDVHRDCGAPAHTPSPFILTVLAPGEEGSSPADREDWSEEKKDFPSTLRFFNA